MVVLYSLSIRNKNTNNIRELYGTVTPNVIEQYWEGYAYTLEPDEELVIDIAGKFERQID